jgi:hypothetical protein
MSFGIHFVAVTLGITGRIDWSMGPPDPSLIPQYVHILYNISHSLILFAIAVALLYKYYRRLFVPFLAYGFAVALDIPTHTTSFFATPFLWPISSYKFDGVNWSEPYIFYPNVLLIILAYAVWYGYKRYWGGSKRAGKK